MPTLPRGIIKRPGRTGYYVRIREGGQDRTLKAGDTVGEAVQFRDKRLPRLVSGRALTVKEAASLWLERWVGLRRNEAGKKLAKQRVESDLIPALGYRPLLALSADDCRQYRIALERKPRAGSTVARSPQTIAHLLADLRCLLAWAEESGFVDRSPFPRRLIPRVAERAPDRLTDEEVARLVRLHEPYGFYLRLLLGTGIRWGEAVRAEAQHVERGSLLIPQSKNGRVRRVPLSPELMGEIRGRVGRLVHLASAQALAVQARDAVKRFHVHMTRHTFACRWLEAGGSVTALQEALGHRSILTTQRYGRPNEEAVRREAERGWG